MGALSFRPAAAIVAVAAVWFVLSGYIAQAPSRTIGFIVTFPAGGGADLLTRLLAEQFGNAHGVKTLIENRPGAAAVIGTDAASRGARQQHGVDRRQFVDHPSVIQEAELRPLTRFEPICLLATSPQVIVVNSSSPYCTLTDLVNAARAKLGELSHASIGPTSAQHIAFERLEPLAKLNMIFG